MSNYLLDTGPLSAYLLGRSAAVAMIGSWVQASEAATSIVCCGEALEYAMSFPEYDVLQASLMSLSRSVEPLALDLDIMERYGRLRRSMRRPYGPGEVGDIDTLIAATALEFDLTVVTTDSDFERVPDLKLKLVNFRRSAR